MADPSRTAGTRPARLLTTLLAPLVAALVALAACAGESTETIDSRGEAAGGPAAGAEAESSTTTTDAPAAGADDDASDDDAGDGVTTITSDESFECTAGEEVVVTGSDLEVDISGSCGAVLVDGVGLRVTIGDAGALTVSGTGNQVEVTGSTDGVSVSGTGHQVTAAGDPPVDDDGVGTEVD